MDVHDATIKPASVEIKTLAIGGKQITLAAYLQLFEEAFIEESIFEEALTYKYTDYELATFRGVPWGTVNYHPDKTCADLREHRHVVWQKGQELRRATVLQWPWYSEDRVPRGYERLTSKLEVNLLPAWFAIGVAEGSLEAEFVKGFVEHAKSDGTRSRIGSRVLRTVICDIDTRFVRPEALRELVESRIDSYEHKFSARFISAQMRRLIVAEYERQMGKVATMSEIAEDIDRRIAETLDVLHQFTTSWESRWTEITALDQLFIDI
jgi:hypothetical protein